MTFEEALGQKLILNSTVSSKIYRVCPNPQSDSKGYNNYILDIKNISLTDEDAKKYSSNKDFDVFEGGKQSLPHIKI